MSVITISRQFGAGGKTLGEGSIYRRIGIVSEGVVPDVPNDTDNPARLTILN